MLEANLTLARRHVRRGREIISEQKKRIESLRQKSLDCSDANAILKLFEETLAIYEVDLSRLEAQARRKALRQAASKPN